MNEKYKSPKNKVTATTKEKKKLYSKYIKVENEMITDDKVPAQVLFGLIEGAIRGPLK